MTEGDEVSSETIELRRASSKLISTILSRSKVSLPNSVVKYSGVLLYHLYVQPNEINWICNKLARGKDVFTKSHTALFRVLTILHRISLEGSSEFVGPLCKLMNILETVEFLMEDPNEVIEAELVLNYRTWLHSKLLFLKDNEIFFQGNWSIQKFLSENGLTLLAACDCPEGMTPFTFEILSTMLGLLRSLSKICQELLGRLSIDEYRILFFCSLSPSIDDLWGLFSVCLHFLCEILNCKRSKEPKGPLFSDGDLLKLTPIYREAFDAFYSFAGWTQALSTDYPVFSRVVVPNKILGELLENKQSTFSVNSNALIEVKKIPLPDMVGQCQKPNSSSNWREFLKTPHMDRPVRTVIETLYEHVGNFSDVKEKKSKKKKNHVETVGSSNEMPFFQTEFTVCEFGQVLDVQQYPINTNAIYPRDNEHNQPDNSQAVAGNVMQCNFNMGHHIPQTAYATGMSGPTMYPGVPQFHNPCTFNNMNPMAAAIYNPSVEQVNDWEIKMTEVTLEQKIGSGATANVYKGVWRGTEVAVKELTNLSQLHGQPEHMGENLNDFVRELNILKRLRHPNLVLFMGASIRTQPLVMVSEFCAGGTLFEFLHGPIDAFTSKTSATTSYDPPIKLTWEQKIKLATDIAKGCAYLHDSSPCIIHRDLKSLNILLADKICDRSTSSVTAKVTDFGLSRVFKKSEIDLRRSSQSFYSNDQNVGIIATAAIGTYHWMAPEVFRGQPYDEKVDVYSFGIVLYEIITHKIPFEEFDLSTPANIGAAVAVGTRPNLSHVPADCPTTLRDLMINCWCQAPRHRPSFKSILSVLKSIFANNKSETTPPPTPA